MTLCLKHKVLLFQHKNDTDVSPPPGSGNTNTVGLDNTKSPAAMKPKRPMNAFLLFAKDVRVNFTQKFPKRDNR